MNDDENSAMIEVFGALFAVLLLILIMLQMGTLYEPSRQIQSEPERETYYLSWPDGNHGYAIQIFSDFVRIIEKNKNIPRGHVCDPESTFLAYAREIYITKESQLLLQVFNGAEKLQEEVLDCLREVGKGKIRISMVIADIEVLKAIPEGKIPAYVNSKKQHF